MAWQDELLRFVLSRSYRRVSLLPVRAIPTTFLRPLLKIQANWWLGRLDGVPLLPGKVRIYS